MPKYETVLHNIKSHDAVITFDYLDKDEKLVKD